MFLADQFGYLVICSNRLFSQAPNIPSLTNAYYRQLGWKITRPFVKNPTAALIKALLINGAVDISGQYIPSETGPTPNVNSGFGRVDLGNSVIIPGQHSATGGFEDVKSLDDGNEYSIKINVGEWSEGTPFRLKVTLVYSDPPGQRLQNDLNLIVTSGDGVYERHGNNKQVFTPGSSEGFDRCNNVEQVDWPGIPRGMAEITIRAYRITKSPQPFAYAWRVHNYRY
ncbi:hypothetical protein EYZ11_012457 [Aspergillus tanneri]|uniref:Uncharacterized protein n=1 Tax=Aspergillus tanneri TaxID=1220188 RepID=A0A4S3J070_9EURO|nr:hypothetical protein EYZ11_012457 [Aspergillus tanneri]